MSKVDLKSVVVGLQSPWVIFYKKVFNLLSVDPEIQVGDVELATEGCYSFNIYSKNGDKLEGLRKVLRTNVTFGNVILAMKFILLREDEGDAVSFQDAEPVVPTFDDWKAAFTGNPHFVDMVKVEPMPGLAPWIYAVFAHEIITFYSDDLTDIHGNSHYVVADLVKEVSRPSQINICTDYTVNE